MSAATNPEQAVAYAALILADDSIAITPEKLQTLLKAASIEDVEPIWTTLFAKALEGKEVKDILTKVEATGPGLGALPTNEEVHHDCCNQVAEDGKKDGGKDDDGEDSDCDFGMSLFD
jgi:large subunit ribosomal protein LP1